MFGSVQMFNEIPGGVYKTRDGKYQDAEGQAIPEVRLIELGVITPEFMTVAEAMETIQHVMATLPEAPAPEPEFEPLPEPEPEPVEEIPAPELVDVTTHEDPAPVVIEIEPVVAQDGSVYANYALAEPEPKPEPVSKHKKGK
jgi:hypothetical protein